MENYSSEIHGKLKWDVNSMVDEGSNLIPSSNGYFGGYTLITYKGKQAIVYVDDRDAVVEVKSVWADKIFYGRQYGSHATWDGDYRWNHDMPVVVMDEGKYNLNAVHSQKLLMETWADNINPTWLNDSVVGYYLDGEINGRVIRITTKGTISYAGTSSPADIKKELDDVKTWNTPKIVRDWIEKERPCYYIHGLEYKGAGHSHISKDKALELIKTHNRFSGMFNSAEWRILDGDVALLFRDYSGSDYD